jgi:hypothetical protein
MSNDHARITFSAARPDIPGTFNMVEIQTGGDVLLKRLRTLCEEFSRGERVFCDMLAELPAEGIWLVTFRAYLGRMPDQRCLTLMNVGSADSAEIEWRNTAAEWARVCDQLEHLLQSTRPGLLVSLCNDRAVPTDGFLSVER